MNHFTEIFIEYAHIWGFLFCFFASMLHRMRDLSSLEIKPITPEVDTQSPKQWTAREFQYYFLDSKMSYILKHYLISFSRGKQNKTLTY